MNQLKPFLIATLFVFTGVQTLHSQDKLLTTEAAMYLENITPKLTAGEHRSKDKNSTAARELQKQEKRPWKKVTRKNTAEGDEMTSYGNVNGSLLLNCL